MIYPKEVYCMRVDQTIANKREYDRKRAIWYAKAEELFPDYHKMNLRDRMEAWKIIDETVGFRAI